MNIIEVTADICSQGRICNMFQQYIQKIPTWVKLAVQEMTGVMQHLTLKKIK
jgi:hypothetical protein